MGKLQKVALVVGAIILIYFTFFNYPTKSIVVNNPSHKPYDRRTPAYINETIIDYKLMFYRTVGVMGATGVACYLLKPTKIKQTDKEMPL